MKKNLLLFSIFIVLVSCNARQNVIKDENTQPEPNVIQDIPKDMTTADYNLDTMGRNRTQYHVEEDGQLIINPDFSIEDLQRGDIIYYRTPEKSDYTLTPYRLSRIIALPGESVEINQGQIYINDQKLDTFYGEAIKSGLTEEEYIEYKQKENPDYELSDKDAIFNVSMKKLEVPSQHVFVIGDNWSRSVDSRRFGPLKLEGIEGVVIGVTKEYNRRKANELGTN